MKLPIQSALIAAMFFAAQSGLFADNARPGDKVAARWTDGGYYLATITGAGGGGVEVLYDDGDKGTVNTADVMRASRTANINVGDHVLAAWRDARMYPGVVTAKTEFTVTVQWDDGDKPLEVARDRAVLLPREAAIAPPAVAPPAGALPAGTSVAAKWGGNSFYIATIAGTDGSGKYLVNYGDGDKGAVAAGDIVRVDSAREIQIGAHVLACWHGARMYPGIVTAKSGNLYTVKWDDGDTPLEVAREQIAPFPSR